jgi:chemotaxis protein MotB
MAGKGGGAWKVAYADFVTAMMAFFMVMWLLSQNDKVKQAVALHFRNPYGQFAMGDSLMAPRHTQYFKDRARISKGDSAPAPETKGPTTRKPYTLTLHRGDRSIVGTVVTFEPHETDLNDEGREQLKGFVPRIHGKPQKIEIRGHALRQSSHVDPAENEQNPWSMSYERCLSAMNYLIEQGIPAERLRLSQAGPFEPYTLGDQPDQVANNSRIEVYMLNEVAEDAIGKPEERDQRYRVHGETANDEASATSESNEHDSHANDQAPMTNEQGNAAHH